MELLGQADAHMLDGELVCAIAAIKGSLQELQAYDLF